jgi:hypothetical protein
VFGTRVDAVDNHDGIIELPADAPLGVRYIDHVASMIRYHPEPPDALASMASKHLPRV